MSAPAGRRLPLVLLATLAASAASAPPWAGGSSEHAVLIVDPGKAESMYVANYYKAARDLPDANFVWMAPGAANYQQFAAVNVPGFLGALADRGIEDHVDFVVIPPGGSFYVSAPGLISDGCFPVTRFTIATGYTMARNAAEILGGMPSTARNHYCQQSYNVADFRSSTGWLNGSPSTDPDARRYYMAGMLGYTGSLGNTLPEILQMIDRSVAVDGTSPAGTFYFMETNDYARSSPRHMTFPAAVQVILNFGGSAQHLLAVLPLGQHDCMGIMTGLADPAIDTGNFTLLDGSFADHLTSYAGTFDTSSQTKMSRWIAKGASGTAGTVEEPCNYAGKFPHARLHVEYFKGLCLGEAWFRGSLFVPFQTLFYGDPLTRPYARIPVVDVPAPPTGTVSGVVVISPTASATLSGAAIGELELLVDGVVMETAAGGGSFALDTRELADGWHELRVMAYDDSKLRDAGRWVGALQVQNHGHQATLSASATSGDLGTRFDFTAGASGGTLREIRLLSHGRVVAAAGSAPAVLGVHGQNLGAGPLVRVQAEAHFADGSLARSAPVDLAIAYSGATAGTPPVAFGFTRRVRKDTPFVLELPAAYGDDPASAVYGIVQAPANATILSSASGPYRVVQPDPGASCTDTLSFSVTTPSGTSGVATITLEYGAPVATLYGCGINPAGSLQVLSGTPRLGATVVLGLDDPTGATAPGALPLVVQSRAPHANYPCGGPFPSFGPGGAGEVLVSFARGDLIQPSAVGAPWIGPGNPAPVSVTIPSDCTLVGESLYAQGLLLDVARAPLLRITLTDAVRLDVGP